MPQTVQEIAPTRDRILTAARELFWLQGYEATSIAEIVEKANVNPGSLYYFFKSKEALLLGVLDWYLANLSEVMDPVFRTVSDPIERVFGILDGYRRGLSYTACTGGCPIGNLSLEVGDHIPAAREKIAQNFENWRAAVRDCLVAAGDRLPPSVDRAQLATFILTVMEGAVMQARARGNLDPFDASVAQLRAYFDALIATTER
ncbi:MAG TPA: TetR/AcrR family transcriptional regulator [Vicinamibacteria bacterium]|nr:TetR/AcrR family transcriptional regulator [Vicinamibacteria bacterium]